MIVCLKGRLLIITTKRNGFSENTNVTTLQIDTLVEYVTSSMSSSIVFLPSFKRLCDLLQILRQLWYVNIDSASQKT